MSNAVGNAVGRAFYSQSGQTKDYAIGICCFSTKHVALRRNLAKTGWLGIRILYPSGVTCLSNYNTGNNALLRL